MNYKTGGPAFPRPGYCPDDPCDRMEPGERGELFHYGQEGMSLRDFFAAQALIGFQVFIKGGWSGTMPDDMAKHCAENCYALADAMIAQREKGNPNG